MSKIYRPKIKPKIALKFEPRDLWIGVYWTVEAKSFFLQGTDFIKYLFIYICIIPCLPIILRLHIGYKPIPRGEFDARGLMRDFEDSDE